MIPQEDLSWLVELPESVLSARGPQVGRFAISYLAPTLDFSHDMYMMDLVRKDLTRNLGRLQPSMFSDIKESIDDLFGTDTRNWNEICLFDAMQKTIFKSSNRVFVGSPLCHNERFLRSSATFATSLGMGAILVGQLMPSILKPIFGYMFAAPIYVAQKVSFRYLVPEIEERIMKLRQKRANSEFKWEEPKDMLMWMVVAAMDRQDPKLDRPVCIAERILFFVSFQSSKLPLESKNTEAMLTVAWRHPHHNHVRHKCVV